MFTEPYTWTGGSIDLLIALGPSTPERQLQAMQAVWRWPALVGPYAQFTLEPELQPPVSPGAERLYGVATLPDGARRVAFATSIGNVPGVRRGYGDRRCVGLSHHARVSRADEKVLVLTVSLAHQRC